MCKIKNKIIRDMKKGNIMRDVISSSQFTENVIKEYKKGLGDMVLVAITPRTTIELPAHCLLYTSEFITYSRSVYRVACMVSGYGRRTLANGYDSYPRRLSL